MDDLRGRHLRQAHVAADLEIREMLEPVMRADQTAISRFPTNAPPIGCSIDVLVGEQDPGLERLAPQE